MDSELLAKKLYGSIAETLVQILSNGILSLRAPRGSIPKFETPILFAQMRI